MSPQSPARRALAVFLMNHVKSSPPDLNSKSAFAAPSSTLRTRKCHIVSAQFLFLNSQIRKVRRQIRIKRNFVDVLIGWRKFNQFRNFIQPDRRCTQQSAGENQFGDVYVMQLRYRVSTGLDSVADLISRSRDSAGGWLVWQTFL